MKTPQDELQRLYEEASAMEGGQPAPEVRSAVLAHAAMLAQDRIPAATSSRRTAKSAANWPNWKSGLVASVLLVPLLGVFVLHLMEAPEIQEQIAAVSQAEAPVVSPPAAVVAPLPALTARAATAVANSTQRKAEPARAMVAKATNSAAPAAAPAPSAPVPAVIATEVAAAGPAPVLGHPSMQGTLGAVVSADSRSDRAEASLNRARESAPTRSGQVAATAPAMAVEVAPAKSRASAGSVLQRNAALLQAAQGGNVQLVQSLLNEGASLEVHDARGRTPLMLAVIGGHEILVHRLMEKGANTAVFDQDGLTALQHARRLGFVAIANLLE